LKNKQLCFLFTNLIFQRTFNEIVLYKEEKEMRVDLPLLKNTISSLFTKMDIVEIEDHDTILFCFYCGSYYVHAALRIFEVPQSKNAITQALGFSLAFTDQKQKVMNLAHKEYSEVAVVCTKLQQRLDWGILSAVKMPDGSVEIALYRSIHTSQEDLVAAKLNTFGSEFTTALVQLQKELEYIAPVLQHYAVTEDFDMKYIDFILNPTASSC